MKDNVEFELIAVVGLYVILLQALLLWESIPARDIII